MKNIIISGLIGGIVIFLLGGLFYGGLFAEFFRENMPAGMEGVMKEPVDLPMIAAADLLLGLLLAIIFHSWADLQGFSKGAALGMVIGLGLSLHYNLIFSGTTNLVTSASAIADISINTFNLAIGGGVIGAILGKMNKARA